MKAMIHSALFVYVQVNSGFGRMLFWLDERNHRNLSATLQGDSSCDESLGRREFYSAVRTFLRDKLIIR